MNRQALWAEARRVRVELIVIALAVLAFAALGISRANLETIIFKLSLVAAGSIMAHAIRQLMFPYIPLMQVIFRTGPYRNVATPIRAVLVGGMFLIYAAIILGVVLAI